MTISLEQEDGDKIKRGSYAHDTAAQSILGQWTEKRAQEHAEERARIVCSTFQHEILNPLMT